MGSKRGRKKSNPGNYSNFSIIPKDARPVGPEVLYVAPDIDLVSAMYEEGRSVEYVKPSNLPGTISRMRRDHAKGKAQMSDLELTATQKIPVHGLKPGFGDKGIYFKNGGEGPVAFIPWGANTAYVCSFYSSVTGHDSCLDEESMKKIARDMSGLDIALFAVEEKKELFHPEPDFPGDVKKPIEKIIRTYHAI